MSRFKGKCNQDVYTIAAFTRCYCCCTHASKNAAHTPITLHTPVLKLCTWTWTRMSRDSRGVASSWKSDPLIKMSLICFSNTFAASHWLMLMNSLVTDACVKETKQNSWKKFWLLWMLLYKILWASFTKWLNSVEIFHVQNWIINSFAHEAASVWRGTSQVFFNRCLQQVCIFLVSMFSSCLLFTSGWTIMGWPSTAGTWSGQHLVKFWHFGQLLNLAGKGPQELSRTC